MTGTEPTKKPPPTPEPNVVTGSSPYDTNPLHIAGENYDDYRARVRGAGVLRAASDAEWANAVHVNQPARAAQEVAGTKGNWGYIDGQGFPVWNQPVVPPPSFASMTTPGQPYYNQITAYPSNAWATPGDYVQCTNGDKCYWNGGAWVLGVR